jgi:hypothetical protein
MPSIRFIVQKEQRVGRKNRQILSQQADSRLMQSLHFAAQRDGGLPIVVLRRNMQSGRARRPSPTVFSLSSKNHITRAQGQSIGKTTLLIAYETILSQQADSSSYNEFAVSLTRNRINLVAP